MQIRDYMTKLFDALGDTEEVTREKLLEQAELIHIISGKCQSTGLFLDSQDRFNQFVKEIETDNKVEDRLLHAWYWLLDRVVKAPTSFHMDGAVILTMPLVAKYLPEKKPEHRTIVLNLDEDYRANIGSRSLCDIVMSRQHWPNGATCATQEADGEILYWNAPVAEVEAGRLVAGQLGMMAEIGLKHQVDFWFEDMDETQLAMDWNTAVITPLQLLISYLDLLRRDKVTYEVGIKLAIEWIKKLGGSSRVSKRDGVAHTILTLDGATADCFVQHPDSSLFYYEA